MPQLAAEGLTAERLACWRAGCSGRKPPCGARSPRLRRRSREPRGGRVPGSCSIAQRFAALAGRDRAAAARPGRRLMPGMRGRWNLRKLEALFSALSEAPDGSAFRRTLAGAMVTRRDDALVIERAPARRAGRRTGADGRIPALTTRKTGAMDGRRNALECPCSGRLDSLRIPAQLAGPFAKAFPDPFPWQAGSADIHWTGGGRATGLCPACYECGPFSGRRGSTRTRDERKSPELRPLGDHRPVGPCAVHTVPVSEPASGGDGYLLLAAPPHSSRVCRSPLVGPRRV